MLGSTTKPCTRKSIINTSTNLDFRGTYSEKRLFTFFPPMVFGVRVKRTAFFPKHSLISSRKRSTTISYYGYNVMDIIM